MKSNTLAFGLLITAGLVLPALAGPREDVLEAFHKCATIADGPARLACYDAVKPQLEAALQAPPAADTGGGFGFDEMFGGGISKPQTTPEQFGSERLPQEERDKAYPPAPGQPVVKDIDSISGAVTDYALDPFGHFLVFLDNGQVWKQVDSDIAHFRRNAKDNAIVISRGFMGSYTLKLNDGAVYKVKRLK